MNSIVEVINMDTLDGAIELKERGFNPVLHNMCNPAVRGGFFKTVGAQEEDLIRRGNYMDFLKKEKYPMKQAIYSKNVCFVKKGPRDKYKLYDTSKYIDVIAFPAIYNIYSGLTLSEQDEKIMINRINIIFSIAYKMGHDSIVLSAFGCGGFRCPPEHVARLFNNEIQKFKKYFKIIRFCIFDENFEKSNYNIFKQILNC